MKISYFVESAKNDESTLVSIRVRVRHGRGIDLFAKTSKYVSISEWNPLKEEVKDSNPDAYQINYDLGTLKAFIAKEVSLHSKAIKLTSGWLNDRIDTFFNNNKSEGKPQTLFTYFEQFISKIETQPNIKTGRPVVYRVYREYCIVYDYLKRYSKYKRRAFDFEDIDRSFYTDFVKFLQSIDVTSLKEKKRAEKEGIKLKPRYMANNTIASKIKKLKSVMNDATYAGINNNLKYKSAFNLSEDADTVYLNEIELQKLNDIDLSKNERLDRVRDLFLVGCWTGLRFSDLEQVEERNIKNGMLYVTQKKTVGRIVIPIHKTVERILAKYGGRTPESISNQKFNDYLKELCQKAELNSLVLRTLTRGGIRDSKHYEKWELITTHTARRSFATNLFKQGVKAQTIMQITGHKTEGAFLRYLRISAEENAKILNEFWSNSKNS